MNIRFHIGAGVFRRMGEAFYLCRCRLSPNINCQPEHIRLSAPHRKVTVLMIYFHQELSTLNFECLSCINTEELHMKTSTLSEGDVKAQRSF